VTGIIDDLTTLSWELGTAKLGVELMGNMRLRLEDTPSDLIRKDDRLQLRCAGLAPLSNHRSQCLPSNDQRDRFNDHRGSVVDAGRESLSEAGETDDSGFESDDGLFGLELLQIPTERSLIYWPLFLVPLFMALLYYAMFSSWQFVSFLVWRYHGGEGDGCYEMLWYTLGLKHLASAPY